MIVMSTFFLKIEMVNDAVLTCEDIAQLLKRVSERIEDYTDLSEMDHFKNISDINGNIIGKYAIKRKSNIIEVD